MILRSMTTMMCRGGCWPAPQESAGPAGPPQDWWLQMTPAGGVNKTLQRYVFSYYKQHLYFSYNIYKLASLTFEVASTDARSLGRASTPTPTRGDAIIGSAAVETGSICAEIMAGILPPRSSTRSALNAGHFTARFMAYGWLENHRSA